MKRPSKIDLTINTIMAAVVSALTCDSIWEFVVWFPLLTIVYALIDGICGRWE